MRNLSVEVSNAQGNEQSGTFTKSARVSIIAASNLISDALPFLFPNFAPPFSVEQVGMEVLACFPTNENVFALLRVARIIFESQMANDSAP
jgi:hypothetical protein